MASHEKYWIVFTDGVPSSFKRHWSLKAAEEEAVEIAIQTQRKATVMESVCFFLQPPAPQPERFDMKSVEAPDATEAQMQ